MVALCYITTVMSQDTAKFYKAHDDGLDKSLWPAPFKTRSIFQTSYILTKKKIRLSIYMYNLKCYENFTSYLYSFRMFYYFLQAFMADVKNPRYVDFAGTNKLGTYIDQTLITGNFCKWNPYECRWHAQYERMSVEITYLEEIYHSVYKGFMSVINNLDYHLTMNNTKYTGTLIVSSTNWAETLCNKHDTDSQLRDNMMNWLPVKKSFWSNYYQHWDKILNYIRSCPDIHILLYYHGY